MYWYFINIKCSFISTLTCDSMQWTGNEITRNAGAQMYYFLIQAEDGIRDYKVDWSSDVCSSDLPGAFRGSHSRICFTGRIGWPGIWKAPRSEERRVVKECRSRWSPDN